MRNEIEKFYALHRRIFGVCPCCNELFRLSDAKVFAKRKPEPDWMDELEAQGEKLDRAEEKLADKEGELREKAREAGRKQAAKIVRKIDPIFAPRKLNPDDAKVMFHPVDYVVFDGMKAKALKRIVLLDREAANREQAALQESIARTVERGDCEWRTIRVADDGSIEER